MRELLLFSMPQTQAVEIGVNTIQAIVTIDESGLLIGELISPETNERKMKTPTMPNRGSRVISIPGSDTVNYFNPDCPRHYQSTIARYEHILTVSDLAEAKALLAFTKSGVAKTLDYSQIKIPKGTDPQPDINKVRLAFVYAPTGKYIHECQPIIDYWIELRRDKPTSLGQIRCSITGKLGTPLVKANADIKFGNINAKIFTCNTDDAVSFGSVKYNSTGVTTETYTGLVQRINYLGSSNNHRITFGDRNLLIWTDGTSIAPLMQAAKSSVKLPSTTATTESTSKKTRSKGSIEAIEIGDCAPETIVQGLFGLWKGVSTISSLDVSKFYTISVTAQKKRCELSIIRQSGLVSAIENIANFHAKQLRFSRYSHPYWSFLDAIYPAVSATAKKPYANSELGAIFDCAMYNTPLPKTLINKALGRLKIEGVPISSKKHHITLSNRTYTQLSFLSLAIPLMEITNFSPSQQQAYALGRLYSYACRQADKSSSTPNHGVRKMWGQINRNPKRALAQLSKRFPIYASHPKDLAVFNKLYRTVMEANSEIPELANLDYSIAFMWGISIIAPKAADPESIENSTSEEHY